jgi:hypothetical protein
MWAQKLVYELKVNNLCKKSTISIGLELAVEIPMMLEP